MTYVCPLLPTQPAVNIRSNSLQDNFQLTTTMVWEALLWSLAELVEIKLVKALMLAMPLQTVVMAAIMSLSTSATLTPPFIVGDGQHNKCMSFTAGGEYGKFNHSLTVAEMPNHAHNIPALNYEVQEQGGTAIAAHKETKPVDQMQPTSYEGQNQAFGLIQPSIGIYRWVRTA